MWAGASVWWLCFTGEGLHPAAVPVVITAAALRKLAPDLHARVMKVTNLMVLGPFDSHPHVLSNHGFERVFSKDIRVAIAKATGSKEARPLPFDMMLRNHVLR